MDMVRSFYKTLLCVFLCGAFSNSSAQTTNSAFRPFSFAEMAAPFQMMKQFQDECLNTLMELMDKAESVESYIDKNQDPTCWNRYTEYYNSIVDEYQSILKSGTNQGTRNRIFNLRKNFIVIDDIKRAYNRRYELSNSQYQRISATHEKCTRYYSAISLDEFLDGNTPTVTYY